MPQPTPIPSKAEELRSALTRLADEIGLDPKKESPVEIVNHALNVVASQHALADDLRKQVRDSDDTIAALSNPDVCWCGSDSTTPDWARRLNLQLAIGIATGLVSLGAILGYAIAK